MPIENNLMGIVMALNQAQTHNVIQIGSSNVKTKQDFFWA